MRRDTVYEADTRQARRLLALNQLASSWYPHCRLHATFHVPVRRSRMNAGLMYIVGGLIGAVIGRLIAGRMDRGTVMLGIATGVGAGFAIARGPMWLLGVCAIFLVGTVWLGTRARRAGSASA
jgi:hypothetical protein